MNNLDYPGRSVSHLKSAVVEWSVKSRASRDDDSRLPNDSANGTPSHKICDSLSHNRSEEIDVHNLKQFPEMPAQTRKSSAARIDLTLALSPSDTTGKPPLAPGRRHRARISSSKSLGERLRT